MIFTIIYMTPSQGNIIKIKINYFYFFFLIRCWIIISIQFHSSVFFMNVSTIKWKYLRVQIILVKRATIGIRARGSPLLSSTILIRFGTYSCIRFTIFENWLQFVTKTLLEKVTRNKKCILGRQVFGDIWQSSLRSSAPVGCIIIEQCYRPTD